MSRQPGRWQLPSGLAEHGLDPLHRLGGHHGGRGALGHLVRRLQGGGEVHQPLDLDAVAGAHVRDVVEVGRRRDQLRAPVGVATKERGLSPFSQIRIFYSRVLVEWIMSCLIALLRTVVCLRGLK